VNEIARPSLPELSPPERFNRLIEGLFSDITTRTTWVPVPPIQLVLLKLIWRRLCRMSRRFAAIMTRFQAGTLAEAHSAPRPAPGRTAGSSRPQRLSQRLGWFIHAVSYFVWNRHYELEEILEDPRWRHRSPPRRNSAASCARCAGC